VDTQIYKSLIITLSAGYQSAKVYVDEEIFRKVKLDFSGDFLKFGLRFVK